MPFPRRIRRPGQDEQFGKFLKVIKKLYVNIPLLNTMQVPTYAKYITDILNWKHPITTFERGGGREPKASVLWADKMAMVAAAAATKECVPWLVI
ncbi:hypothetical protein E2562_023008 [Oryza meyeriana var. granulata]|uniref:Uncharacterized protein n=1 Tax=Oryza meyeriana var. granulata TaxID=110450 RepID=A0A6G1EYE9_9ORYZ|nr:hypothetical protein E2562_023008 [Oryza meyeriana var. granulata]